MRDRCSIPEIESGTAKAVSLLGAGTTLFGLINLFVTGWTIKRIGVKGALLIQVFWPAVRLAVQNIGVAAGGNAGIIIVQSSQIITIIGGPNGYLLALNSFITEVTEHEQRTPALGRLQGAMFFGTSIGYLVGGEISERFGIIWPFRVTLGLFCLSTIYVFLGLPWIPKQVAPEIAAKTQGIRRFFGPLKIFAPQKWVLLDGRIKREFGPILLAFGLYLGILATGYIPVLLQMYSTDVFGFGTRENGFLISLNSMLRAVFLTFLFPRIIAFGRKKVSRRQEPKTAVSSAPSGVATPVDVTDPNEIETADAMDNEQEPLQPLKRHSMQETFDFDLIFARYSLLLDGILTGAATFIRQGWQIYLVAIVLPFAAGTGAASKGTILQMCPASERTDALSAITLVENMARLTTSA
jgi:MFS family permease